MASGWLVYANLATKLFQRIISETVSSNFADVRVIENVDGQSQLGSGTTFSTPSSEKTRRGNVIGFANFVGSGFEAL